MSVELNHPASVDKTVRRDARRARKALRLSMMQQMQDLRESGLSPTEIGQIIGMTNSALNKMARSIGIRTALPHSLYLGTPVPRATGKEIKALAARAGVATKIIVRRILICAGADGGAAGTRLLGKWALPVQARRVKAQAALGPSKRDLQKAAKAKRDADAKQEARDIVKAEREAIERVRARRSA